MKPYNLCQCHVCVAWRSDIGFEGDAPCGLCGTPNPHPYYTCDWSVKPLVWTVAGYWALTGPRFLPKVVQEFLRADRICGLCRNVINAHVNYEWGLCWATAPDDVVQWALVEYIVSDWNSRIHTAERGFRNRAEQSVALHGRY